MRLFETFKDGNISDDEITFVKRCLNELDFEISEEGLVNMNVYTEVMMSFFVIYGYAAYITRSPNLKRRLFA